jgi:ABC-type lipoprotein export system ATPase subunit
LYLWKTKKLIFKEEKEEDEKEVEDDDDRGRNVGFVYESVNVVQEEEDEEEEHRKKEEFEPEKARFQRITIGFENLGLVLDSEKRVLSSITGELAGGSLTAIMGPSGSGKSVGNFFNYCV